jgi:hypothetical protein
MLGTLFSIPANQTSVGANTFAVEIHQVSANSSDIGFDFEAVLQLLNCRDLYQRNPWQAVLTTTDQIVESSDWMKFSTIQKQCS